MVIQDILHIDHITTNLRSDVKDFVEKVRRIVEQWGTSSSREIRDDGA